MNTQQLAEYLETYGPKSNIDRTALLAATELRRLHEENERLKAQQQEPTLQEQLDDALQSLDFYRRRVQALQQWQSRMRDPERTIVCDIIANGCALEPAGDRYKLVEQQEPGAWRELCRRLYVELFHCDQQMMATLDEYGEPVWTQGKTVRDVLADAKAALETSPPASKPWVGLTDDECLTAAARHLGEMHVENCGLGDIKDFARAIEAKLKEKNNG